jgi:ADP-ribosylglycohydrolase
MAAQIYARPGPGRPTHQLVAARAAEESAVSGAQLLARAHGCALGHALGDALGAAVEGFPTDVVRQVAAEHCSGPLLDRFILHVPMGTFVSAGQPGQYRPATEVADTSFVPTGPPMNAAVAEQCARLGCYTDDTNAALAVGSSIRDCGRVDAQHVAQRCAEFVRDNELFRGCPPTAKAVAQAVLSGVPAQETGLPPHFAFEGGSFANGGAMKISLLAIAYRNAPAPVLRSAVTQAVLSTHRHVEAVDFAVVQAAAVQHCLRLPRPQDFDAAAFLGEMRSHCEADAMAAAIDRLLGLLRDLERDSWGQGQLPTPLGDGGVPAALEVAALRTLVQEQHRPGSSMDFQIASVHMMPCVLWCVCRAASTDPRLAVLLAIDLGGDTDTAAAMVGAIVGALHGSGGWCTDWPDGLENGAHGRDFILQLAADLTDLDVRE